MRRAKGVELALGPLRKTAQSAQLAQAIHAVAPAREDFVGVGLVAHIPHQAVLWRVKNVMQGYGELDRTEVGTQVPAGFADGIQQVGAQFIGKLAQLGALELAQIHGRLNRLQQRETAHQRCRAGFGFVGHIVFLSVRAVSWSSWVKPGNQALRLTTMLAKPRSAWVLASGRPLACNAARALPSNAWAKSRERFSPRIDT